MGYFFRPRFPNADYLYNNKQLFVALAKQWDAKKNKYSFAGGFRDKEFAHWRFWGYFIHEPHYKDFIERLFIVVKDPTCDNTYDGTTIWRRRFNTKRTGAGVWGGEENIFRGDGFNKKWLDAYTLPECNDAFQILKQLVIDDKKIDWDEQEDFFADLKQSLKYIMFSKWEDYEAY